MLEVTGKCIALETAIEFFEMLPDNIPDDIKDDEFCDEYEAALNTFRQTASRLIPAKPKTHKGKHIRNYYTCGKCGSSVQIEDDFCRKCGRTIGWDSIRCFTGYKED